MSHPQLHPSFAWRLFSLTVACVACLFITAGPAAAKRSAPQPVAPVLAGAVEYSAPHEVMGFVIATDTQTHQELWRERIYRPIIDPSLERDVQEVFIASLAIERRVAHAPSRVVAGALAGHFPAGGSSARAPMTAREGACATHALATRKVAKRK